MENSGLTVDTRTLSLLLKTARWTMMLAVILLIGMVLGAFMFLMFLFADMSGSAFGNMVIFYALFFAIGIGVHVYPTIQLINYRKHIKEAAATNDNNSLYSALTCISNFFRYVVVAVIATTIIYLFIAMLAGIMYSL